MCSTPQEKGWELEWLTQPRHQGGQCCHQQSVAGGPRGDSRSLPLTVNPGDGSQAPAGPERLGLVPIPSGAHKPLAMLRLGAPSQILVP